MKFEIEEGDFERKDPDVEEDEEILISGGLDVFNKLEEMEEDGETIHLYKAVKNTQVFKIELDCRFILEEEDMDLTDEEIEDKITHKMAYEGSFVASHLAEFMGMNSLPGLFMNVVDEEVGSNDGEN